MPKHTGRREVFPEPPLSRSFYLRPAAQVARELLGKILAFDGVSGRIVETEAYLGEDDGAAHSARGITSRTRVLFGPPGHAYVYFIYGMYDCLNVVCEPDGIAGGVLIRALEPLDGLDQMRARRGSAKRDEELANGPGKLTRALGIKIAHNGVDVTKGPITIHAPKRAEQFEIATSTRIGITKSADLPLRFFIKDNPCVSRR
jgi:DNA-3-methyladenine glycosylase